MSTPPYLSRFPGPTIPLPDTPANSSTSPTEATLFTIPQLYAQPKPFNDQIIDFINRAFKINHDTHQLFEAGTGRLRTPEALWQEFGYVLRSANEDYTSDARSPVVFSPEFDADETFTLVLTLHGVPIATASASVWKGKHADDLPAVNRNFAQEEGPIPDGEQHWELYLMAVDPDYQSRGISKWMLSAVTREIKERVKRQGEMDGRVYKSVLVLDTIYEIMGKIYERWGFTETKRRRMEVGFLGTRNPFTIALFRKDL